MKLRYILPLLLLGAVPAFAQSYMAILPIAFNGQGVMSPSNTSTQIKASNITLVTNSSAFPASTRRELWLRVKMNGTSTQLATFCWQGGTCVAGTGDVMGAGDIRMVSLLTWQTYTPTVICAAASGCNIELEWP